jgi:hypothetical protein
LCVCRGGALTESLTKQSLKKCHANAGKSRKSAKNTARKTAKSNGSFMKIKARSMRKKLGRCEAPHLASNPSTSGGYHGMCFNICRITE